MTILITGSQGLIGANLTAAMVGRGMAVREFDLRRSRAEDIRNQAALATAFATEDITGVVHLAAVSRVAWAERDPERCRHSNVHALKSLLALCASQRRPPWVVFGSGCEVYGNQKLFPVAEVAPLAPISIYGRSAEEGERLVEEAKHAGLVASTCRFSSVYGWPHDHADRVVMACARAACCGGSIVLEGADKVFDFTFVDDVIEGLLSLIDVTRMGVSMPPIHFVSGVGTSLSDLAQIACEVTRQSIVVREALPKTFEVDHFVGDPSRASTMLGWRPRTDVRAGLSTLISRMSSLEAGFAPPLITGVEPPPFARVPLPAMGNVGQAAR